MEWKVINVECLIFVEFFVCPTVFIHVFFHPNMAQLCISLVNLSTIKTTRTICYILTLNYFQLYEYLQSFFSTVSTNIQSLLEVGDQSLYLHLLIIFFMLVMVWRGVYWNIHHAGIRARWCGFGLERRKTMYDH